jgi:hypothetical protein
VARDRVDDPPILVAIVMSIVDRRDRVIGVVQQSGHRLSAEAEPRDDRRERPPKVVRRERLDPAPAGEPLQPLLAAAARQRASEVLGDEAGGELAQLDRVRPRVLRPRAIAVGRACSYASTSSNS